MKILLFAPALGVASGSGVRARLIATGLRHAGAEVFVIAGAVPTDLDLPEGSFFTLPPGRPLWETLDRVIATTNPDVVYGITEAGADQVLAVARRAGLKVAFDLHGLGFVEALEVGGGGWRPIRMANSLRWLNAARRADLVTVANPTLLPVLRPVCRRVLPVFGMTDLDHFRPDGERTANLGGTDRLLVLYAGNHYRWQGLDLLVAAVAKMGAAAERFRFVCLGDVGQDERRIAAWKSAVPDELLAFRGGVGYRQVADYYRRADVLVIPRPFMLSTYLAFPQKLVDGMASGRTIVATNLAPHRWALQQPPAGVLCAPHPGSMAAALATTADAAVRQQCGAAARRRAEAEFCHLRQSQRIFAALQGGEPPVD